MPTSYKRPILDVDYIRSRRNEVGLSRRALAASCHVTDRFLLGLERGDNHSQTPLMTVARLAEALGVEITDLLVTQQEAPPPRPDDVRLEAALLHLRRHPRASDLRAALRLSESQWEAAVESLRARLAATGATLVLQENGYCWIAPREGALTRHELDAVKRPERSRTELNLHQARALKRIIDGENTPQQLLSKRATTSDRMAVGYLERNGFIRLEEGRYLLSGDVAYSLGLAAFPARERQRSRGGAGQSERRSRP